MRRIPLTQGQFALVDDEDFARFGHMNWYAIYNKTSKSFYAYRYAGGGRKNKKNEYLHRKIMGVTDPHVKIDHENHDTLDCRRRTNLRIATVSQNGSNRKGLQTNNTSGIRGVVWDKSRAKWKAQIKLNGKMIQIGRFIDKVAAASAYAAANRRHFGAFGGKIMAP